MVDATVKLNYNSIILCYVISSIGMSFLAAIAPKGKWTFFSWHPFLMTIGFYGLMGSAAVTKKLGGYSNTKLHGILSSAGLFCAFGGLYIIYKNKENMGKDHLTTNHALAGIVTVSGCIGAMFAGGVFLHPDFGIDKTNKTIRLAHKWFGRIMIISGWVTAFMGLMQITDEPAHWAMYGVPMGIISPLTFL